MRAIHAVTANDRALACQAINAAMAELFRKKDGSSQYRKDPAFSRDVIRMCVDAARRHRLEGQDNPKLP